MSPAHTGKFTVQPGDAPVCVDTIMRVKAIEAAIGSAPDPTADNPDGSGMRGLIVRLDKASDRTDARLATIESEVSKVRSIGEQLMSRQSGGTSWARAIGISVAVLLVTAAETLKILGEVLK